MLPGLALGRQAQVIRRADDTSKATKVTQVMCPAQVCDGLDNIKRKAQKPSRGQKASWACIGQARSGDQTR